VEIFYSKTPVTDYLQSAYNTVTEIHRREPAGDILVFLTGQEEIDTLVKLLKERDQSGTSLNPNMTMQVLPLYAGLSNDQQMRVFKATPQSTRKVVVATNIAETSVTIEGVVYVIDCGFVKIRAYNPKSGLESLVVVPESQSSANQRAGRAGRVRPGKCYRLFTEDSFHELAVKTVPEMQRSNLAMIVIQLKAMGIDNVLQFDFMSPPPAESMIRALELLYALNALDDSARLTESIGSKMAEFPIDPTLAKMLLSSGEYGCSEEMVTIAAMLTVQSVFVYPKDARKKADAIRRQFAVKEGDHLTLLNVFVSYMDNRRDSKWCHSRYLNARALDRAFEIRKQLVRYLRRFKVPLVSAMGDVEKIIKALISGYFANAARLEPDGQCYRTIRQNHRLFIHPNSVLFRTPPQWVIFSEVVLTSKEFMREVTSIKAQWLSDIAPHFYEFKQAQSLNIINKNIEENITKGSKDNNTSGGVLNYSPF
jgi:ATP-dependent RNA helicase DDX35